MSSSLVIQWSRLGDILHTRPLLRALKRAGSRVTLSFDSRYMPLAARLSECDDLHPVNLAQVTALSRHCGGAAEAFHSLERLSAALPQYDQAIVLTRSMPACLVAEQHASRTLGFQRRGNTLEEPEELKFINDNLSRQQRQGSCHIADVWIRVAGLPPNHDWIESIATAGGSSQGRPIVAFICDAGDPVRSLPPGWVMELSRRIIDQTDCTIRLFGLQVQFSVDIGESTDRLVDLRGATGLDQLISSIEQCTIAIGPDTGALHLAASLGVPCLGLYVGGPRPSMTGPYVGNSVVIESRSYGDVPPKRVLELMTYMQTAGQITPYRTSGTRIVNPVMTPTGVQYKSNDSLAVIIPEHGVPHYTHELLQCLRTEAVNHGLEVVVVSSGSEARSSEESLDDNAMRVICHTKPLSYARACNIGAAETQADWLLFLNNDTIFNAADLNALFSQRDDHKILSPVIFYPDGLVQNCGVTLDTSGICEAGHGLDRTEQCAIQAVSGVAMLMHRSAFELTGGFDEGFVNGYEDIDLCLRAKQIGIVSEIVQESAIIHFRSSSPDRMKREDVNLARITRKWRVFSGPKPRPTERRTRFPLVFVSDSPSCAAGPYLRWINPLRSAGLVENRDFAWLQTGDNVSSSDLAQMLASAETVVVFRPLQSSENTNAICDWKKRTQGQLWVDCDDLYFGRFNHNSARGILWREIERNYSALLQSSDVGIVSTDEIADNLRLMGFTSECYHTIPQRVVGDLSAETVDHKTELRIGFCGSPSHLRDLGMILPAIELTLNSLPEARFYWWGCRPGDLAYHPSVRCGGPWIDDYRLHLKRLSRMALDTVLVPSLDTTMNRARSPIKCFDYWQLGVPAIYSNLPLYSKWIDHGSNGMLCGENTNAWVDSMITLAKDNELRTSIARTGHDRFSELANVATPGIVKKLIGHCRHSHGILRQLEVVH